MSSTSSAASSATAAANREAAARYAMDDRRDFADADRGFIAAIPDGQVLRADGSVMFDLAQYGFLSDDAPAPDTVNPSLWRQSQVMHARPACTRSSTASTRCATTTSPT